MGFQELPISPEGTIGTDDHTQLVNRNAENQHTISSIIGLSGALGIIEEAIDRLNPKYKSNADIVITGTSGTVSMIPDPITIDQGDFEVGEWIQCVITGEITADGNRDNEMIIELGGVALYDEFSSIRRTQSGTEVFKIEFAIQALSLSGDNLSVYVNGETYVPDSQGSSIGFTGRSILGSGIVDNSIALDFDVKYRFEDGKSGNINVKSVWLQIL